MSCLAWQLIRPSALLPSPNLPRGPLDQQNCDTTIRCSAVCFIEVCSWICCARDVGAAEVHKVDIIAGVEYAGQR